jgi:hypothetical protein
LREPMILLQVVLSTFIRTSFPSWLATWPRCAVT